MGNNQMKKAGNKNFMDMFAGKQILIPIAALLLLAVALGAQVRDVGERAVDQRR